MILETVRELTDHPKADDIYDKVQIKCPGISKGTVYRVLNLLAEEGIIYRVSVANAPDRYDLTALPHAHCRCRVCGRVYDCKLSAIPTLENADDFDAESYDIMVNGVCVACT